MAAPEPEVPSTARMIDYFLGGHHHYPVDVAAAEAFESLYGPCAAIFRSLRSFAGRATHHIAGQGIDQFLVFGAGVPTQGSVHETVPGARVLYTDIDPEIVALGRQILGDRDGLAYTTGDATDLASIDVATLDRVLPDRTRRPVGLVFLGLAAFFDDVTLARTLDALYAVVPAGSQLVFDFDSLELSGHPEALAMMGPDFHMRDPAGFAPLLGRWTPGPEGIVPVARWRPEGEPEPVPDAFWGGVAVS